MEVETKEVEELNESGHVFERFVSTLVEYGISKTGAGALTLQLFGGEGWKRRGRPVRGHIHLGFIAGERTNIPGLVDYLTDLKPRSARVNASNSTYTGLTGPVRSLGPDSGWYLEEGVLTDSTTDYLAIQNPEGLNDKSVDCLKEAVGSGGVTISKKGYHETVPVNASILLIGHPIYGDWDEYTPLNEQTQTINSELASKLDFIYPDFEDDEETPEARYIEDIDVTREYIKQARDLSPEIPQHVDNELFEGLVEIHVEKMDADSVPRQARDTIKRLAMASARTRWDEQTTVEDAQRAITIYRRPFEELHGIDYEPPDFDLSAIPGMDTEERRKRRRFKQLFANDNHWDEDELIARGIEEGFEEWEVHRYIGELKGRGEISQDYEDNWYAVDY